MLVLVSPVRRWAAMESVWLWVGGTAFLCLFRHGWEWGESCCMDAQVSGEQYLQGGSPVSSWG